MIGRVGDELRFNATALALRAQRQEVIGSNLANAETPNFKARDFDFASALKAATGAEPSQGGLPLATTARGHIPGGEGGNLPIALQYRIPSQPAIDGNTVDPDLERTQFADNTLRYEASLRMLNGQISTLRTAISGQ